MGVEVGGDHRSQRHGQDHALRHDHGSRPTTSRRGRRSPAMRIDGPTPGADRPGAASPTCRRAAGCSASLTVDEHLTMLAKGHARQALDAGRGVRAVPTPRRAPAQHGGARSVRRRAADARRRPGAAAQRLAGDDGRAVRGARTDDRRHADRGRAPARRRGQSPCSSSSRTSTRPRTWPSAQLVMVSGRIEAETTASELLDDPELQRRYLGVGHAIETTGDA